MRPGVANLNLYPWQYCLIIGSQWHAESWLPTRGRWKPPGQKNDSVTTTGSLYTNHTICVSESCPSLCGCCMSIEDPELSSTVKVFWYKIHKMIGISEMYSKESDNALAFHWNYHLKLHRKLLSYTTYLKPFSKGVTLLPRMTLLHEMGNKSWLGLRQNNQKTVKN